VKIDSLRKVLVVMPEAGWNSWYSNWYIALAAELNRVGAKYLTTHFYGSGTPAWAYSQRELHASLPMLLGALGVAAEPSA
jgi:S-formylglutathione hydrolase FrmB